MFSFINFENPLYISTFLGEKRAKKLASAANFFQCFWKQSTKINQENYASK